MIEQINHLAQLWWGWTSAMFWQAGLLIALIALVDRLIRRWAWPQLRYALWSLILVKLVFSPALSLPSGLAPKLRPIATHMLEMAISEPQVTEKLPPVLPFFNDRITHLAAQSEAHLILTVEDIGVAGDSVGSDRPAQTAGPRLDWRSYAMAVWFLGMAALGSWLLVRLRRLRREHPDKSGRASLPESFHDQLAHCAKRLGLRRKPTVVVTGNIQTPAVFGLFRPVLLMPVGYIRNLSRKDTEHLLLHELAHIKRGDLVVHSFHMLLQVMYWYNPLLWLVRRRLRHLRELCCDATVAGLLRERTVEYRRTLLEAARQFLVTPVEYGLGLVGLFEDSNCLISRINWLEKPIWRYQRMKKLVVVITVLALVACVLPMAQAQQDSVSDSSSTDSKVAAVDSAENSTSPETEQELAQNREQLLKAMKALQFQLQQLQLEKQKLQHELQAVSHAEHDASDQAHQAAEHAAHAELKAKEAKDKSAKVKSLAEAQKTKAQAEYWGQWAKQMEKWAQGYEEWAESDKFKQWQKDMQKWAQSMAQAQMRISGGEPGPMPKPGPMPVMPPMPSMPAPVAPMPPMVLPKLAPLAVSIPEISTPGEIAGIAPTLPGEAVAAGESGRDIEITKDKDGKFVATTQMHFVSKVKAGASFVIRNDMGRIVLRPSKDGTGDVRAIIRGKAESSDQARAKVAAVGMKVDSSDKRYYLKPVRRDGGQWEDLTVDLHISVPPGVLPDLQTKMGSVELYDLEGKIKAVADMGAIKAVNTTGDLELHTKMGSIEFVAPKDLSAVLSVQTKMGSIKSDLPLEISQSDMFRKGAQGTIGAGQGNIRMTTDMGSISLTWHSPAQDSPVL